MRVENQYLRTFDILGIIFSRVYNRCETYILKGGIVMGQHEQHEKERRKKQERPSATRDGTGVSLMADGIEAVVWAGSALVDAGKQIHSTIAETVSESASSIVEMATESAGSIAECAGGAVENIGEMAGDIVGGILDGI